MKVNSSRCNGPYSLLIRGRIRPRNVTRRNRAGNEIKRRSESTTMRYSQPPFKDFSCLYRKYK